MSSEWTPVEAVEAAPAPRPRASRRRASTARSGLIAVVLLVAAVICFACYLVLNGSEHHSFNSGASAPATVHVTQGKQYEISTPDGLHGLARRGIDAAAVACTYSLGADGPAAVLSTTTLAGSRTTHAVATFIAPVTGDVSVKCTNLTAGTFVDDADNGAADPAGFFVLAATVFAGLAVPLGMGYLYRRSNRRPAESPDEEAAPTEA